MMKTVLFILFSLNSAQSFVLLRPRTSDVPRQIVVNADGGNFFEKLMQDVDNFIDDASSRRLGNGASFYGKRKSSFYGEEDSMKKKDSRREDSSEDYQGPTNSGYFVWRKNEEGVMQPQTRLKGKPLERFVKERDDSK
mmetsp:Transcript_33973/g.69459  ORF Transcript_33973/g.69459 Transcript_33973/m.69459 type:complete len:138 (+) Transcript_33973:56-469(+)